VAVLDDLKAFDVDAATASLWVFKGPYGGTAEAPAYTAYSVETTEEVDGVLKEIVKAERDRITEWLEYDLLAQPNEVSALTIGTDETYADLLTDAASTETRRRAETVKKLRNSSFYLIKLISAAGIIYAVRRTSPSWKTRRAISARTFVLRETTLALDESPRFDIEKTIDFFILADELLILNKGHFETTLRYKQAHAADFADLQQEAGFSGLFVDTAPLIQHVGSNKIQLRRMCAVRQKAHYLNPDFMDRVRADHAKYGFALQFDAQGKIIVTPETASQIITALLDHRLVSGFSDNIYDVQSTTRVPT
jgi:hypothetical protein